MTPRAWRVYGRALWLDAGPAHARSGDRIAIAAYLGTSDAFDRAIAEFAEAYADQNDRDHRALLEAIESGRVAAEMRTLTGTGLRARSLGRVKRPLPRARRRAGLTDPVLRERVGPLVRIVEPAPAGVGGRVDAVLLSHIHADHADPVTLRGIGLDTPVVAPRGGTLASVARELAEVHELGRGRRRPPSGRCASGQRQRFTTSDAGRTSGRGRTRSASSSRAAARCTSPATRTCSTG